MTIDTTLPASDPLKFKKNLFDSYKNDNNWSDKSFRQNIPQNEVQYDLDKKAAIISPRSSKNLDKVEYLIGACTIEQARFEYSPLGKVLNKGLSEDDKKEGLFKRLKSIEDKNEVQLKGIEDKNEKQSNKNLKSIKSMSYFSQLTTKAKELFEKIKKEKNDIDPEKFVCVKTDGTIFNFNKFKNSLDLTSDIYRNQSLFKNAENKQNELRILLNDLKNYNPTSQKKVRAKEETLSAAEKLLNNRKEVINAFKTDIFPYIDGFQIKEESEEESDEELDQNERYWEWIKKY